MTFSTDAKIGTRVAMMLKSIQTAKGFLSDADLYGVAQRLDQPLHKIEEVVSFYPHFRRTPPVKCRIDICRDMACRLRGSKGIVAAARRFADSNPAQIEVHETSCLGRCDRAPAAMINDQLLVNRTADEIVQYIQACASDQRVKYDSDRETASLFAARAQIDVYGGSPKYRAVAEYVQRPAPETVIQALHTAGLLGMGGAGGRTYLKWNDVFEAAGDTKYVICNGDESEPGTFKDRDLLLAMPHLVLEGMIIAGLVVGATQGFVYIRHEYHEQIEAVRKAIENAEACGACGANIFGSGRAFFIEVFVSPGGYICGEQTALVEAIEGKRAEPRNRPPELQTNGLYDQPTLLNNVETLAWVPAILLREPTAEMLALEQNELSSTLESKSLSPDLQATGARHTRSISTLGIWYKRSGQGSGGSRLFSVSGDVHRPGVYEVPCGITLGALIDDYCGGMQAGQRLRAVALSGPSGGFLPAILPRGALSSATATIPINATSGEIDVRNLPLDVPASRKLGFMLGGGIVVYGNSADMLDQAIACSRFFQSESCGKCVPCRLGSQKILDLAESLAMSQRIDADPMYALVEELGRTMVVTSICGLGQVASNPLRSYLRYFLDSGTRSF